jgi:hypothetical protein
VDIAEPPRIVFESPARCADGHRAEELLKQVLAHARAPGNAWVVTMRIDSTAPGVLRGDGEITDDGGAAVGHRVVTGKASDCGGLARAIGVWASLVLDAEINRPRPVATADPPSASTPEQGEKSQGDAGIQPGAPLEPGVASADPQLATAWPPTPPGEKPSRREDGRTLEVGAGGFLMTGMTGSGGGFLVGASPFLVVEVSKGFFLRPAIALGGTLASNLPPITMATTRLDACIRVAGLYTNLHGMQLDICGGTDVGMLDSEGRIVPYVAFGPSLDLRGELGGDLAVVLRGLVNVNAAHDDALDTPLWGGRAELAMSWRLR